MTRGSLPGHLKAKRLAMFANGAIPSDDTYEHFHSQVKSTRGCEWYTAKVHSNYRTNMRRQALARRADVKTTRGDAGAAEHAITLDGLSLGLGTHMMLDAHFSTRCHPAPLPVGPVGPTNNIPVSEVMQPHDVDVGAQIHVARDPMMAPEMVHWAAVSGVPTVNVFISREAVHLRATHLQAVVAGVAQCDRVETLYPGVVVAEQATPAYGVWDLATSVYCGDIQVLHYYVS